MSFCGPTLIILFFPVSINLFSGLQSEEVKGGQGAPGLYLENQGWRHVRHGEQGGMVRI